MFVCHIMLHSFLPVYVLPWFACIRTSSQSLAHQSLDRLPLAKKLQQNVQNSYAHSAHFRASVPVDHKLDTAFTVKMSGMMTGSTEEKSSILCCMCGLRIHANPSNMCMNCLKTRVDITDGIPKQVPAQLPTATRETEEIKSRTFLHSSSSCPTDYSVLVPWLWALSETESMGILLTFPTAVEQPPNQPSCYHPLFLLQPHFFFLSIDRSRAGVEGAPCVLSEEG